MEDQTDVVEEIQQSDVDSVAGENSVMPAEKEGESPQGEQTPEKVEEVSPEIVGLRQARDDNAAKLREASTNLDRITQENAQLRNITQQLVNKQPVDEFQDDPDEPLTRGEWQKLEKEREAKRAKELQEKNVRVQEEKVIKSANRARKNYAKEDFTYDMALDYAEKHPDKIPMIPITMTEDPAQTLYDLVLIQPENKDKFIKTAQANAVKKTVETINENLNQAGTLSDTGGGDRTLDEIKKYEQMSYAEIIAEADAIIKQRNQ